MPDYFAFLGPDTLGQYYDQNQLSFDVNYDMKSSAAYYSMPMTVEKTQQIDDVGIYINSVSGTNALYLVSIRTLDTDGLPTTTNYGGSTGTPMFANQFVKGWNWIPLGISATGTSGDVCAPHIQCVTGSSTNYIAPSNARIYISFSPRVRSNTGGTEFQHPLLGIRYADDTVQGMPLSNLERLTVGVGGSPTEYGMRFTVPVEMVCHGMRLMCHAVNSPFRALLFDGADVIRVTYIADEDQLALGGANEANPLIYWTPATLTPGNVYRAVIQPTSGGLPMYPHELTLVTGSYQYIFPGSDQWQVTYRTNSGSSGFTDDPTKRTWMSIMVSFIGTGTSSTETTTILSGEGTSAWAY